MHLLGAILAVLSAATFALTNATGRRGVISGTPAQGMVISMPVGLACFLAIALLTGAFQTLSRVTAFGLASLSAAGVLHFVFGRYCNLRATQAAGVNLTAPVMQLNSVVTLVLAVVVLRESCTMLQVVGAVLMVAGSFVTQSGSRDPTMASKPQERPVFAPRVAAGVFFAALAAFAYGTSPIIIRQALLDAGPLSGVAGGSIAYGAATIAVALGLLVPSLRRNVTKVSAENARWFVYSGIFVAAAQGFLYSALALAPIMVIAPLLQLSLVFRFLFSYLLNPHHEIFGLTVVMGSVVSIIGACTIAVDTQLIVHALSVPEPLAAYLRSQL
ncbi:MAG TPA: EamA family transporter [Hyphomicrobiaceae bacterium]